MKLSILLLTAVNATHVNQMVANNLSAFSVETRATVAAAGVKIATGDFTKAKCGSECCPCNDCCDCPC